VVELKNCKKCGKLFSYIGGSFICPACKDEEEALFQAIKKYLRENPGASVSQVSSELGIGIERIKKFLKDGRLEIIGDDGQPALICERCGKPIKTGRFCEDCNRNITIELLRTTEKWDVNNTNKNRDRGVGMRYLTDDFKKKEK
jgi:flagellar operon protein (TIGR03826 family)